MQDSGEDGKKAGETTVASLEGCPTIGLVTVALTIGKLARELGLPISTLRFYERRGLLKPEARSGSDYRLYGTRSLETLRFIRSAQASGFSLDDIATLLKFEQGRISPCGEVQDLIGARMRDLDRRLQDLRRVQAALRRSLRKCKSGERTGRCVVLSELRSRAHR